jgi:hypothetical protein
MFGLRSIPSRETCWRWSAAKTVWSVASVTSAQRSMVWSPSNQHLGLDDRDESRLLAEGGVARKSVGVGVDAVRGRDIGADRDDGAPLGEAGAETAVLGQALAEPVQALGDQLAGAAGQKGHAISRCDRYSRAAT